MRYPTQSIPTLQSLPTVQPRESQGSRAGADNAPNRTGILPVANPNPPAAKAGRTVSTVPAVLYEKVVAELEQARRKVQQLSQTNHRLENHNETLAQELQQVAAELQGDVYRALTRLQILAEANETSAPAQVPSSPAAAAPAPPAASASSYSFLDRLKTRQQEGVALGSQPSGRDNAAVAPDIDPLDPFAEEGEEALAPLEALGSVPSEDSLGSSARTPRSRAPRSRPTRSSSRVRVLPPQTDGDMGELTEPGWDSKNWRGSQATEPPTRSSRRSTRPSMREEISPEEELFGSGIPTREQDLSEDSTASGYGSSVYHRGRNRQPAQQSLWIWGILSLLLVTGCFTAGFFVVQSVVRGGNSGQPTPSSPL